MNCEGKEGTDDKGSKKRGRKEEKGEDEEKRKNGP